MKKQLVALFVIASLLFVIGCGAKSQAPDTSTPVTQQVETQPTPQPSPQPSAGEDVVDNSLEGLDTLDEDLDMSELDSLDEDLDFEI